MALRKNTATRGHRCFTLPGTSCHEQISPGHQVPRCLWTLGECKQLPAVLVQHRQTKALHRTICAWTICSSPTTMTMARCGPGGSAYINRRTPGRWLCMKQNAVALRGWLENECKNQASTYDTYPSALKESLPTPLAQTTLSLGSTSVFSSFHWIFLPRSKMETVFSFFRSFTENGVMTLQKT